MKRWTWMCWVTGSKLSAHSHPRGTRPAPSRSVGYSRRAGPAVRDTGGQATHEHTGGLLVGDHRGVLCHDQIRRVRYRVGADLPTGVELQHLGRGSRGLQAGTGPSATQTLPPAAMATGAAPSGHRPATRSALVSQAVSIA